jgi:putative SOS response-associated peptidase YedK
VGSDLRLTLEQSAAKVLEESAMCGRYVQRGDKQKIAEAFRAAPQPAELPMPFADYNIAPTTYQPIIRESRESGEREMVLARWGLVPFFTKELGDIKGLSTINARAETIAKAPTWREPCKKRRCLIPASAFYEWPKEGKSPKQPYILNCQTAILWPLQAYGTPGKTGKVTGSNRSRS